jgi:cell division transport system permease protein
MRLRLLVSEAWRSLGANVSTTVAATMTVLIGMFLLGLSIAFGTWIHSFSNHVKRELVVHVYYCTPLTCNGKAATPVEINAVAQKLQADPRVKDVTFISKEAALTEMRKRSPELAKGLTSNPLPPSEEVIPRRGEDVEAIALSVSGTNRPAGVEKVNYGKKKAHAILKAANVIDAVFVVAVLIILAASTLLIANTIRLSIFSRRREIEVMKLVGATNWFVRGPFVVEGLLCGVAGALLAIVLMALGKFALLPSILGRLKAGADVHALSFSLTALILLGVGLALGALGSGVTIRRFLQV